MNDSIDIAFVLPGNFDFEFIEDSADMSEVASHVKHRDEIGGLLSNVLLTLAIQDVIAILKSKQCVF